LKHCNVSKRQYSQREEYLKEEQKNKRRFIEFERNRCRRVERARSTGHTGKDDFKDCQQNHFSLTQSTRTSR
jgi:hypothetical protein